MPEPQICLAFDNFRVLIELPDVGEFDAARIALCTVAFKSAGYENGVGRRNSPEPTEVVLAAYLSFRAKESSNLENTIIGRIRPLINSIIGKEPKNPLGIHIVNVRIIICNNTADTDQLSFLVIPQYF